jgi:hypothetical protein
LLETAGLHAIAYERLQLRNYLRPIWNHCHIMGMEELSRRMSRGEDKPPPLQQQIKDLEAEFAQGASVDAEWFIMVGQMPDKQE